MVTGEIRAVLAVTGMSDEWLCQSARKEYFFNLVYQYWVETATAHPCPGLTLARGWVAPASHWSPHASWVYSRTSPFLLQICIDMLHMHALAWRDEPGGVTPIWKVVARLWDRLAQHGLGGAEERIHSLAVLPGSGRGVCAVRVSAKDMVGASKHERAKRGRPGGLVVEDTVGTPREGAKAGTPPGYVICHPCPLTIGCHGDSYRTHTF